MHNKTKTNTELPQTMGSTLNTISTTTEPPPKMHFTSAKSSLLLNTKLCSSHGGFLANVICHHRETIKSNYDIMMIQGKGS